MLSITADSGSLTAAIAKAAAGLSPRPLNPVHAGMLVSCEEDDVLLTASDGNVTFTSVFPAIHAEGAAVFPGRMLAEISKYFTGDIVSIEAGEHSAVITAGKSRFTLSVTRDYPGWSGTPESFAVLDGEEFSAKVRYVAQAASDVDPVLHAMRLEITDDRLEMVATDRSRMASASAQVTTLYPDAGGSVLAPAVILERFSRIAGQEVSIGWNGNLLGVRSEGLGVVVPQVSGQFIKGWEMIRGDYGAGVTADAAELARLIRMAELAAGKSPVKFTFEGESLLVSASGDAECTGELEIRGTIGSCSAEFSPRYLLPAITGQEVQLYLGKTALLMRSSTGRTLVQPRRRRDA